MFAFYLLDQKIRNRARDKLQGPLKTIQDAKPLGFLLFHLWDNHVRLNPGRQLYEKSLAKYCYLSENTCSVKGKFSFWYKNKQNSLAFSSLSSCLLWGFRTQLRKPGAQRLPFQKEERLREEVAEQSPWASHIHTPQPLSSRKFR